jgi:hypothetical protein
MSVVNGLIYVRNSVNHGAFHVDAFGAGPYLPSTALSNTEKANFYMRSLLQESPSGELWILR